MEKKDLKKLTKGQLIKLLLKKVSNHEDLLDNDPFNDEVAQEPTKCINPIQYGGGGALWPPYRFSLISPERLKLRPLNFLTFSFYLLAIRKM